MSSEGLHEPREQLRPQTIDRHRAIDSIMEELEAVDWYDQRVDADLATRSWRRSSPTTATRRRSTRR